jgi:hypothetical protein
LLTAPGSQSSRFSPKRTQLIDSEHFVVIISHLVVAENANAWNVLVWTGRTDSEMKGRSIISSHRETTGASKQNKVASKRNDLVPSSHPGSG